MPSDDNLVQISSHPLYSRRLQNRRLSQQVKTPPVTTPPQQTPIDLVGRIGAMLGDLHREGTEQRSILRALVACVADLKLLVDKLARGGT